ncbi:amidohydrolase, AtzE family [Thalassobaculum litoreum DSM 18839]|uniref:Amidohydrolase, AtzE family n=1 Tax=Thalassobaculum litoreum DSM 18839 TaxID=1123362 RepID=A0A8G2BNH9_9PROT|nr:amidohydrolase, AtzE family [Thalassobaculum litoreum DSM 18839]
MSDLGAFSPAWKIARAVAAGTVTAEDVARSALGRVADVNPAVNAVTDVTAERALAQARSIDADRTAGRPLPPLAGVPYAVKNLFDITGLPTRAGSKINRDLPPASRDGVLIERLSAAGAVLIGGLNMGEYAYDFTGENAHDGACRNPHDPSRMAGGSSSGSGSAMAAGLAALTLGSDTNGSIRVPASFCGTFGLKPTYGRLTRAGSFPFCDSLDHLGPFARSVRDLALAYDAMQGPADGDAACAGRPVEPVLGSLDAGAGQGLAYWRAGDRRPLAGGPVPAGRRLAGAGGDRGLHRPCALGPALVVRRSRPGTPSGTVGPRGRRWRGCGWHRAGAPHRAAREAGDRRAAAR